MQPDNDKIQVGTVLLKRTVITQYRNIKEFRALAIGEVSFVKRPVLST